MQVVRNVTTQRASAAGGAFATDRALDADAAFRAYAPELRRFALRRMRDQAAGDDIVAEAFARLLVQAEQPRDTRAWLFAVTRNLIAEHHRAAAGTLLVEDPHELVALADAGENTDDELTSVFALAAALTIGDIDIPADAIGAIGLAFVWFLIGFAFFAFLFAGAASLVSRQEDLQNVTTPMTLLMVASLFAGMHASQNPDATLSTVLSFLPPVSAVVMPPRFAAGGVPVWQVLVAYVLMIIATYGVVRLSSRIYTASILKQKSKWREALRASRAS